MTAVVAVRVDGTPVLVGDVVLSNCEGHRTGQFTGKVYLLSDNVVLGWSGFSGLARTAFRRLRRELGGANVSCEELGHALDTLADLRGGTWALELTGWIVVAEGAKVVRWSSHKATTMLSDAESAIGDGGAALREMFREPDAQGSNVVGPDRTVLKAATNFIEARFTETLHPRDWPQTWGVAFDLLVFQGRFLWLPAMTYVGWDVQLDERGRVERVVQGGPVFKQERVDDCTVMHFKMPGEKLHEIRVSTPIYRAVDEAVYLGRPFSAPAPYYGNWFRFWRRKKHLVTVPVVSVGTTSEGLVSPDGDPDLPRFRVNESMFAPIAQEAVQRHRAVLRRLARAAQRQLKRPRRKPQKPKGRRRR